MVYVIGNALDNTDGTILAVLVPSTVAIALTARATGRAGVRSLLRLRGQGPVSARLLLFAALTVPVLALVAVAVGSVITGDTYDFDMPSEGLFILLPLLIVVVGEEYGWWFRPTPPAGSLLGADLSTHRGWCLVGLALPAFPY